MSPQEKGYKQERMAWSVWKKYLNKEMLSQYNNTRACDNHKNITYKIICDKIMLTPAKLKIKVL